MGRYDVEPCRVGPFSVLRHGVKALEMLGRVEEPVVAQKSAGEIETLVAAVNQRQRGAVALVVVHSDFDRGLVGHPVAGLEGDVTGGRHIPPSSYCRAPCRNLHAR